MGALTSHPSPSDRWRFREHPARSSAASGGGSKAAQSPATARGGEERAHGRAAATPAQPRGPARPPTLKGARGPRKGGGRAWHERRPTLGFCPPLLHHSPQPPPTRSRPRTPH